MSFPARLASANPFGPIFAKELRATARRKRTYILRVAYLGVLLLCLLGGYSSFSTSGGLAERAQQRAQLGRTFFGIFSVFGLFAMGALAPVLTAATIGAERQAKTLPALLMTPLTAWQIVSGKLFSRLLAALMLLALSLPVLAVVRLLGGVELGQMFAVVCICGAFAFSSAALGLYFSTLVQRAATVILLSCAAQLFLYAFLPFIAGISGFWDSEKLIVSFHPLAAVASQVEESTQARGLWVVCVALQLGFGAALLGLSAGSLRRLARRGGDEARRDEPTSNLPPRFIAIPPPLPPPLPTPAAEPAAVPDPRASTFPPPPLGLTETVTTGPASRREVSGSPVLWREIRRPLMPRKWMRVAATMICLGMLGLTYLALGNLPFHALSAPGLQIGFAVVFAGVFWIIASVLPAAAIAIEKENEAWTLLLTTPLSGAAILWGKAAGVARRLLWPTVLIAAHFTLFAAVGVLHPLAPLLVLWVILSFNSIWIATGLYLSLRLRRATSAVVSNLLLGVGFYVLPLIVLNIIANVSLGDQNALRTFNLWLLPYTYLAAGLAGLPGTGRQSLLSGRHSLLFSGNAGRFWLPMRTEWVSGEAFALIVVGVGLGFLLVSALILVRTAARFDAIVGRARTEAREAPAPAPPAGA